MDSGTCEIGAIPRPLNLRFCSWSSKYMQLFLRCLFCEMLNKSMAVARTFLSMIWGSHGSEHEDGCLLVCSAVWTRSNDGGSTDLWNTGKLIPVYTALQPRRQPFSVFFSFYFVSSNQWTAGAKYVKFHMEIDHSFVAIECNITLHCLLWFFFVTLLLLAWWLTWGSGLMNPPILSSLDLPVFALFAWCKKVNQLLTRNI
jgi:hypothetical protein